jgi:hypothetical protein
MGFATRLASRCVAPKPSLEPNSTVPAGKVDCLGKSWGTTKSMKETESAARTDNVTNYSGFLMDSHNDILIIA